MTRDCKIIFLILNLYLPWNLLWSSIDSNQAWAGPQTSGSSVAMLSQAESEALLKELLKAQEFELRSLQRRQKLELKDFEAKLKMRQKEWKKAEDDARHRFFAEHSVGAERRDYIKDFVHRRELMRKEGEDERAKRKKEQESSLLSLKQDQARKLKEFNAFLEKGEKPPHSLWPQ